MEKLEVYITKCKRVKVQTDGFCVECQAYHWKFKIVREKREDMVGKEKHRAFHVMPGTNRVTRVIHGDIPDSYEAIEYKKSKLRHGMSHIEAKVNEILLSELSEEGILWVMGATSRYNHDRKRVHISATAVERAYDEGNKDIGFITKAMAEEGINILADGMEGVTAHILHQVAHFEIVNEDEAYATHGEEFIEAYAKLAMEYMT